MPEILARLVPVIHAPGIITKFVAAVTNVPAASEISNRTPEGIYKESDPAKLTADAVAISTYGLSGLVLSIEFAIFVVIIVPFISIC